MNPIHVVGVLDDGPESLPPRLLRLVREADVLAGGERHLALFPGVGEERLALKAPLGPVVDRLRAAREEGRRVTVLASGDPLFYGIGRLLVQRLGKAALAFHPHVTSVALAFARIAEPWDDAAVLSAHGRDPTDLALEVRRHLKVAILTDPERNPRAIARTLLASGVHGYRCYVCANLGGRSESVWEGSLEAMAAREFPPLNVVVLVREEETE
ncbi:precorrin-6y C5,15-methyltransferase (decarboxylating) subunit CbiE [Caldinitratiruptor microaerophilus]|uniref:Tetrapyrrole methylase domain-containing protein n=1 Tax=Caldinitratiruptor microaerophilus TaxID=671077 RepID=A0AA35CLJ8_9FIRM|nr:precorrin-6y C5,15-methyltransferase (decarboxylating) subunit CbiE [Caldinitratiruptor microaerophilus]BDG61560.1 hypothetical protein caldi_26500 [Caldinitratiruptor microaerophilus]